MINEVGDSADEECYSSLNYNSTVPEYSKLKIDDASLASHRPPAVHIKKSKGATQKS